MQDILKMALLEAEEAEVYRESFQNIAVSFQSNRLKSIDSSEGDGIGLRVIKNGKIGFSSITNSRDLKLLVRSALDAANFGQKAYFKFPALSEVPEVKCFDSLIPSIPVEQMVEEGQQAIKMILKEFPSFQCEAELNKTVGQASILNSCGLKFSYKKTVYAFSISAFLPEEGDFLTVEEGKVSCRYEDWSVYLANKVIEKLKLAQKKASIESGSYPVIFTCKAIPLILYPLRKAVNGKLVYKKMSPLAFKLNESIFPSSVTIVDDATFSYGKASSPVDGEGVPARKNTLIEGGILKNFIYDLQTAGLMGVETTGNGIREYDTLPSPCTTNFIVSAGETSLKEMISDMREGLIIDQVIGAGQSNVLMGEFSVNLDLGFKVEKGKITGRVKDVMASGNTYELLKNIVAIGKKREFVGSTLTPPFYFKKVHLTV